jgi:hypothetical protein
MRVSEREQMLLNAALHVDEAYAIESCRLWQSSIDLDDAPYSEARLIPAVYARLSAIDPRLELPGKFRGKARATFARNMMLARETLPVLAELARRWPVVAIKGLSICARYGAWSKRPLGDFDVRIRERDLEEVCGYLEGEGWAPKYGLTWKSLLHRTALRRESWGIMRGHADLDLHWRIADGLQDTVLERELWSAAQRFEVLGRPVHAPSPEVMLAYSLNHGLRQGSQADALQTIIDFAQLLPDCAGATLTRVITRSGLAPEFNTVCSVLVKSGRPVDIGPLLRERSAVADELPPGRRSVGERIETRRAQRSRPVARRRAERELLRSPALYRAWEALGKPRSVERMLLRLFGPMSKPLRPGGQFRRSYDLRNCEVIDQIGGVGWSWPEPDHTCFWADRADVRLLIPVEKGRNYLVALSFARHRIISPAPHFAVTANGHFARAIDFRPSPATFTYFIPVPKAAIFADWLELSFRPYRFVSEAEALKNYHLRRSLPAARLQLIAFDASSEDANSTTPIPRAAPADEACSLNASQKRKLDRVAQKIARSSFRDLSLIPESFDPVGYVLNYPDLLEAEVDPYEHYLLYGGPEGRHWRRRANSQPNALAGPGGFG